MMGIVILRPGLYILHAEAGAARITGLQVEIIPLLDGATATKGGASAILIDCILLNAGILPPGLVVGKTI